MQRHPPRRGRPARAAASSAAPLGPTLLAAVLLAVAVALLGAVFCAVTLALVSADGGPDPWAHAGMIVAGGCLVQVVASLTGTGMGLLLRPALAIPATVIPPLGLYVLLAAVDVLRPAQGWLTPYAALLNLLSGEMSGLRWAQWVVVAAIWAVGLNAAGWLLVKRRSGPVGDRHPAVRERDTGDARPAGPGPARCPAGSRPGRRRTRAGRATRPSRSRVQVERHGSFAHTLARPVDAASARAAIRPTRAAVAGVWKLTINRLPAADPAAISATVAPTSASVR